MQYFLKAQGYRILDNILFQNNKNSILLEKNGKALSSKRNKHTNIQYFSITNRVISGDVSLVWCPTGDTIWDFMTKTLQGYLFRKFRYQIMGVISAQDPGTGNYQKATNRKGTASKKERQSKSKNIYILSLVLPLGQHHRTVLG